MKLDVRGLHVYSGAKEIIRGVSFSVAEGEVAVIMGPNGSGKSSLCAGLMGDPAFTVKGSIRLGGSEISRWSPDRRARKGMFLAFQHPEELEGVKAGAMLRRLMAADDVDSVVRMYDDAGAAATKLGLHEDAVSRELNVGFSGGEKKRLEVLQALMLKPSLVLLDEPDSGLDVDGVKAVARAINSMKDGKRSFLLITHHPRMLKYLRSGRVHVLAGGRIVKTGDAKLAAGISRRGYAGLVKRDVRR